MGVSILYFLRCHNLLGYVDGEIPCPPADNPMYSSWCCTNDNVRSWLYAALFESLLEEVHDLPISKAVWDALQARYVYRSCAWSLVIRLALSHLKLATQSKEDCIC